VLPAGARLRRSADFTATLRASRAARGNGLLVVHAAVGSPADQPRIGFVIPRAVGSAVTRNRVRRRLRHAARERLDQLPGGLRLVVRVLPPAATASYADLGRALDRAMARATSSPLRTVTA
jgi:ribonuclease P protein component